MSISEQSVQPETGNNITDFISVEDLQWDEKYQREAERDARLERQIQAFVERDANVRHPAVLEKLAPLIRPQAKVMEAGCGTGRLLVSLALREGVRAYGVDRAVEALQTSSRLAHRLGTSLQLVRGDMTRLPLSSDAFDIVFSDSVLEHIPDYRSALREMARVTRPGGYVVITVPNRLRPDGWDLYKRLNPLPYLQQSFTPSAMRALYEENGLKVTEIFGEEVLLLRNFSLAWRRITGRSGRSPAPAVSRPEPVNHVPPQPRRMRRRLLRAAEAVVPSWFQINLGVVGQKMR